MKTKESIYKYIMENTQDRFVSRGGTVKITLKGTHRRIIYVWADGDVHTSWGSVFPPDEFNAACLMIAALTRLEQ